MAALRFLIPPDHWYVKTLADGVDAGEQLIKVFAGAMPYSRPWLEVDEGVIRLDAIVFAHVLDDSVGAID